jgi:hypothetical protein
MELSSYQIPAIPYLRLHMTLEAEEEAFWPPDLVLVHLKRHQDVASTLALLTGLHSSSFAHRSRSKPTQLRALEKCVRLALQRTARP